VPVFIVFLATSPLGFILTQGTEVSGDYCCGIGSELLSLVI